MTSLRKRVTALEQRLADRERFEKAQVTSEPYAFTPLRPSSWNVTVAIGSERPFDGESRSRLEFHVNGIPVFFGPAFTDAQINEEASGGSTTTYFGYGYSEVRLGALTRLTREAMKKGGR